MCGSWVDSWGRDRHTASEEEEAKVLDGVAGLENLRAANLNFTNLCAEAVADLVCSLAEETTEAVSGTLRHSLLVVG